MATARGLYGKYLRALWWELMVHGYIGGYIIGWLGVYGLHHIKSHFA